MNRNGAVNGNGKVQDAFLKKSKQKRQSPVKGNWRKNIDRHDSGHQVGTIMPVAGHIATGWKLYFF